jgi:hypothetical protein
VEASNNEMPEEKHEVTAVTKINEELKYMKSENTNKNME